MTGGWRGMREMGALPRDGRVDLHGSRRSARLVGLGALVGGVVAWS